jgi:ADP-heptose:LPS heptosyltransferase
MRQDERETFAALKSSSNNLKAFLFEDFRDTAAALLNLDLVVTADTAVAHLSATLGVPTFILVPAFGTDWRWQLGREDSPWYPAARLYRQPKIGDWPSVITRLRNELAAMAARASAA